MNVNVYIASLVQYGLNKKLIEPCDTIYVTNQILEAMKLDSFEPAAPEPMSLEEILAYLEDLDNRYYAAIPSCEKLAALYGDPAGIRLYRRFRDLHLAWQKRYIADHNSNIWDMNDETHHFSVRA